MTLELDLQFAPQLLLTRVVSLMDGETRTLEKTVEIEPGRKVHLWGLAGKKILILMEHDRKFIGVIKKKGCFKAILSYYESKVIPHSSVIRH